jgi:hypothetical protein
MKVRLGNSLGVASFSLLLSVSVSGCQMISGTDEIHCLSGTKPFLCGSNIREKTDTIYPVILRSDFVIRDANFSKVVQKEVNGREFRQKIARMLSIPIALTQTPTATIRYEPLLDQGGSLIMSFDNPDGRLSKEEFFRLWDKIDAYIEARFQGYSPQGSASIMQKQSKMKKHWGHI